MSDLISRAEAIDALDALCDRECEYSKQQRSVMCGACRLGSAFDVIDDLTSPVKHGKWKKIPSNWGSAFACSECGEKTVETVMGKPRYEYCPMCGARMDDNA